MASGSDLPPITLSINIFVSNHARIMTSMNALLVATTPRLVSTDENRPPYR